MLPTLLSAVFSFALQDPPPAAGAAPAAKAARPSATAGDYKLLQKFAVGGDGSWDYVTVDAEARRLYVPRGNRVLVLDADTGKGVGEIADTAGVHGVGVAGPLGRGFTSNGRAGTLTVFDLKTRAVVKTLTAGQNPDALVWEPTNKRIYVGNGRSEDVTVVDADKLEVVATVKVGGKPEALVATADGTVYVNVEDKSEIVRIDAKKLVVDQHIALAPGEEPSGLALDGKRGHLFAVCGNAKMVVVDLATAKVLADVPIGKRVDGVVFDDSSDCALSSNGEGTITVVAGAGDKPFTVVQTLPTAVGARTVAIDAKTHHLYLPTAEYEAAQPAAAGGERRRPAMKPDSFQVLVVGR